MDKYRYTVPETRRVRVIVDTDCKNEADDQFAVAHFLMTPRFDIRGVVAAHFGKNERYLPKLNVEASYDEIIKVMELMELKRLKEELEAEITAAEDEIKAVMGNEETLLAGAFKVTWAPYTSSRFDSARFKKDHADLAAAYTKTTTTRCFSVR